MCLQHIFVNQFARMTSVLFVAFFCLFLSLFFCGERRVKEASWHLG